MMKVPRMQPYIAFLRGINVGGHRVKMDRLRELFEELGFRDVSTFIASGNVIFSTDITDVLVLQNMIQDHLEESLGYEVATFLRTAKDLEAVAAKEDESFPSHYVIFLHEPVSKPLKAKIAELEYEMDTFECVDREIHWRLRCKMSDSPLFGGGLERVFRGTPTTTRNLNTLKRILVKVRP